MVKKIMEIGNKIEMYEISAKKADDEQNVAVAETAVVNSRHGKLFDVCRQTYAAAVVLHIVIEKTLATATEHCRHNSCYI